MKQPLTMNNLPITKFGEPNDLEMPFGKYKNQKISQIPDDYLRWGAINLHKFYSDHFLRELRRRNPNLK